MTAETLGFQTEAKQLLHLMIHSLYSNKEIFLRELISNASDAVDKLRFEALADSSLYEDSPDLRVRIDADVDARTITIHDNGIGMSREEAIEHLGTIAKSGTSQFLNGLSGDQKKDAQLIGQFGVGFYSAFIVADKVVVETRRAGLAADKAVRWTCEGEAEYTIEDIEKSDRGTSVTLHLKEDAEEYANDLRVRSTIKKYSDHIAVPIEIKKLAPQSEEEGTEPAADEYQAINTATALWTRPRNDIKDEEYKEFYKYVSHDFEDPITWSHNRVEGKLDYTSLLYIPSHAPFDLHNREVSRGLKLYIQRTFIMDDASQFLPLYLRFVKGVLDSSDLPLNVSREILQGSPAVDSIRGALVKRVLDMLDKMAKETPDVYAKFWTEFGGVLKEGPAEDSTNAEKIGGLFRYASTKTEGDVLSASFSDYISRMKDSQDKIYYLVADSLTAARNSTYLEVFQKQGVEVLLLTDRLDEWTISHLYEFDGKQFQDITKGELDESIVGSPDKDDESKTESSTDVMDKIKTSLNGRVDSVRATRRLTDSPACLVYAEHALSPQMRKMMEAAGQPVPEDKPILEVNINHPLVAKLSEEAGDEKSGELAELLYDQAVLSAGEQLDNPSLFVKRLNQLLFEERS
ncbi:MAG: molecular chaperone HtpG [Porticoccus sp.]|nr:molecular chaperone HtpG [Porticoccus sp.]MBQ0808233.1 molecular chaperone HtpG [Porticoccus sp.]